VRIHFEESFSYFAYKQTKRSREWREIKGRVYKTTKAFQLIRVASTRPYEIIFPRKFYYEAVKNDSYSIIIPLGVLRYLMKRPLAYRLYCMMKAWPSTGKFKHDLWNLSAKFGMSAESYHRGRVVSRLKRALKTLRAIPPFEELRLVQEKKSKEKGKSNTIIIKRLDDELKLNKKIEKTIQSGSGKTTWQQEAQQKLWQKQLDWKGPNGNTESDE